MRYIIRKFVDAENVTEALQKEKSTPIHDCYLRDGEQPKNDKLESAIGFMAYIPPDSVEEARRKR